MEHGEKNKRSPIGVIDSGLGGLSVLMELDGQFSNTEFIYLADSAWCPYGNKATEVIIERVSKLTEYLLSLGCGTIVIACNSATISAVEYLRTVYPVSFVGMEPAIKPAVKKTKTDVIGVLATEASIAGFKFHQLVNSHAQGVEVITTACPRFVELVEQGVTSGKVVRKVVSEYCEEILRRGADVLVLGCTHYPFLKTEIMNVVGPGVTIIDTGNAVARRVYDIYEKQSPPSLELMRNEQIIRNTIEVQSSSDIEHLTNVFPLLCPDFDVKFSTFNL